MILLEARAPSSARFSAVHAGKGRPGAAALPGNLAAELDAWAAAGRTATFWWRDDDAAAPTPALDRLLALAGGVPIALAVIPASVEPALTGPAGSPNVSVLQHGWAHANHAPAGERKAEFGPHRPVEAMAAELAVGRARLAGLFGGRALPVLVPPWNRIAPELPAMLPGLGFTGLSVFKPRGASSGALVRCNTHIDPIDWRGQRGFVGVDGATDQAVAHLKARRLGRCDPDEPTGLLTHHLAMDEAGWGFVARFLSEVGRHPAARWLRAEEIFRSPA